MRIRKLSAWPLLIPMLLGTIVEAQTPSTSTSQASPKKPAKGTTSTNWDAQAEQYQALLNDVDISSDPDVKHAIYLKWVDASCKSKRAKVEQAVGGSDAGLATSVYSACVKRLQAQESNAVTTTTTGGAANSGTAVGSSASATMPNVIVPPGCNSLPVFSNDFKIDKPATYPAPVPDIWSPDPKWVELNANSSGGEISTKSTVWLGYITRLRYDATLGGTVTSIAAPTIPNSIFPTATPSATQSKPKAAPLQPNMFVQFNNCFDDIADRVVTFQSSLAQEELLLNDYREKITNHLDSLQPVVNTLAEARSSVDFSILPATEIPAFPIADIVQLRGLLTEFTPKYAEFAQWANADPGRSSEFNRVTAGADSTAKTLDRYLASPGNASSITNPSTASAGTSTRSSPSAGTTSGNPGTGTSPVVATTSETQAGIATGAETQQSGNKKESKPNAKGKSGKAGKDTSSGSQGGTGAGTVNGTANTSNPSGTGSTTGTGTATSQGSGGVTAVNQQAGGPSAIDLGSQEVKDYEANRQYIDNWSQSFRKVATAPAGDFVLTYKPQCGGWFGQGTSTQMQLTVVDKTNPGKNATPKNLDKVVCQSALTVTNGLGLSFIPDRTPAFVPSNNSGTNGSPVLGYSSTAKVRPAYAVQVNAAVWSPRESNFEFHWSLGAMLTAATGGATTDIITGPAFSFKKRAFFISPVYDLGQRTVLQSGFAVGTPQGVLTSPPTQQTWKSGFGLTITFPLSPGSNTTNSSNSAGSSGTGTTGTGATGNTNSKKGGKGNPSSGSTSGSGA
jgi:hypothetical protein